MKYKLAHLKSPCWCNITDHAIEQYISRWEPEKNGKQAQSDLIELLNSAKKVANTASGDAVFASGNRPEVRMVIKDRNVCVTVLPNHSNTDSEEEFQFIVEKFAEEKAAIQFQIDCMTKDIEAINIQLNELAKKAQEHRKNKGDIKTQIHNLQKRLDKMSGV